MSTNTAIIQDQLQALLYCRVSSAKQASQGHGLESQETRCRDYAIAKGYEVAAVFPDDISGGGDFMKRPGMVALLSFLDAQPGKRFVVIFDDLKRFARDTEFHIQLRREFRNRNAQVECLNFKFEDTPEGKFIETIIAAQGELEREQNGRQVRQKMEERLKRGYWTFKAPIGYKYARLPEHGKILVRDEPNATTIQEALEGYASGRFGSQVEVVDFLQSSPTYPKGPTGKLHSQRVTDLVSQLLYAGHIEYPAWNLKRLKAQHEPIINLSTYEAMQRRRAEGAKIPARRHINEDFVLRGAVKCADCSVPLRSCWSQGKTKKYPYYFCQTKGCDSYGKSIARAKVEGAFEDFLTNITPSQSAFSVAKLMFTDIWKSRLASESNATQHSADQMKKLDDQIAKLLDRILETDTKIIVQKYETRLAELEAEKLLLADKTLNKPISKKTFEDILELSLRFLANPYEIWINSNYVLRKQALRLILAEPFYYCRKSGPRTPKTTLPFRYLGTFFDVKKGMVGDERLELPTSSV